MTKILRRRTKVAKLEIIIFKTEYESLNIQKEQ